MHAYITNFSQSSKVQKIPKIGEETPFSQTGKTTCSAIQVQLKAASEQVFLKDSWIFSLVDLCVYSAVEDTPWLFLP